MVLGCTSIEDRSASQISETLSPLSEQNLRLWDEDEHESYDIFNEIEVMLSRKGDDEEIYHLALSGGGVNGAFSAGLLNAWTQRGDRPEFDIVTGVSTGAIVAIYAFLGSDYDQELKHYYTDTPIDSLFKKNSFVTALFKGAFIDTSGFEYQVRSAIDKELVERLAMEREKGRILLIGTTNLDNEKLAIWDIGRIAQISTDKSLALIQDIVIASAAIPGAFPAKTINITLDNESYDELHVDGGVSRQVFLIPRSVRSKLLQTDRKQNIFVIRNGKMEPEYHPTRNSLADISSRSISIILRHQGVGDIEYIYHYAKENNMDYKLAHVGNDYEWQNESIYSKDYMIKLYQYGVGKMLKNEVWMNEPPSLRHN
nr:hypothetical protein BCU58_11480 [Vibrio sp. 10N.286.48.B7]